MEIPMSQAPNIDGVLIQWGDRLFYPGNRVAKVKPQPKLAGGAARQRAAAIRDRIDATVVRRSPQVMVKVTGGGRGMKAIAAHFRYISKNGRLDIEDERGEKVRGKDTLPELAEDWRFGGTLIDDIGDRREAFNIMLSMPRGTDPVSVQHAAREFAKIELADHKYVMVLHDHQANPHVHISVRAESKHGKRLNPRKADLHRWRETFAEKLRDRGVEAEATRQATRGRSRNYDPLWRIKAREDGRLRTSRPTAKSSPQARSTRADAVDAWMQVGRALATSAEKADRDLAHSIAAFVNEMAPTGPTTVPRTQLQPTPAPKPIDIEPRR
jgi:type IV secretory pathway VirD2 relaxase